MATGIKQENLLLTLLTNYSCFQPAFKEAKNVAAYFENNMLKNEATKLATNATT